MQDVRIKTLILYSNEKVKDRNLTQYFYAYEELAADL
jgi:hypothetical protein